MTDIGLRHRLAWLEGEGLAFSMKDDAGRWSWAARAAPAARDTRAERRPGWGWGRGGAIMGCAVGDG